LTSIPTINDLSKSQLHKFHQNMDYHSIF
jgi:hypothetical protein